MQDRIAGHGQTPINKHLSSFEESLADNTPKYTKLTMTRVRRIIEGCGFATLAAIEAEPVQAFLRKLCKEDDLGHRTFNHNCRGWTPSAIGVWRRSG